MFCTKRLTPFGADKTMTAVLSGSADIGFMGSEASIYTYNEGANDYVVNFAQLTQRAGNFLVAREEMPDFTWDRISIFSIDCYRTKVELFFTGYHTLKLLLYPPEILLHQRKLRLVPKYS